MMVDSYSKWIKVEIIKQCNSSKTKVPLHKWFTLCCILTQLVSENGTQFVLQEFANFMRELGIKHIHHSLNGQKERYVQIVKHGVESNSIKNKTSQEILLDFFTSYKSTRQQQLENQPNVDWWKHKN